MIYTTTESVPERNIKEILGVVTGNVVQAKHIGGEIHGYTEILTIYRI